jgi:hypothetical protein
MALSEKIFAMNNMEHEGFVVPGDLIRVQVDWVIASEASWTVSEKNIVLDDTSILRPQHQGMERTYERLVEPGIFRNDQLWLAGDHGVDPRVNQLPRVQAMINASERAERVFKMTDYQGLNVGIP